MGCHRAAPAALAFVAGIFAAVVVFQAQHVSMHGAAPPAAAPPLAAPPRPPKELRPRPAAAAAAPPAAARAARPGLAWSNARRRRKPAPPPPLPADFASRPAGVADVLGAEPRRPPARSVEAASTRARLVDGAAAAPRGRATIARPRAGRRGPGGGARGARATRGARRWPAVPRSCRAYHPRTVIYNRIPKCGSGSVNIFLTAAEERNAYQFCRSTRGRGAAAPPPRRKSSASAPS